VDLNELVSVQALHYGAVSPVAAKTQHFDFTALLVFASRLFQFPAFVLLLLLEPGFVLGQVLGVHLKGLEAAIRVLPQPGSVRVISFQRRKSKELFIQGDFEQRRGKTRDLLWGQFSEHVVGVEDEILRNHGLEFV